eukprot:Gregarina_sp_Pseudo_9__4840@NODE_505_length_2673_cov_77_325361_g476_i0_p1_GENE_NODE_505_length_2673_cov_77_325361_g476_i0NODE_505_length_2673_cov_77_325361_g476_i0_p1_ORF_typecomplete_len407_score73_42Branch/PF02485_21/7_2e08_NODE_505_length_2673_cov_77_325361_g476_i01271347
MLGKEKEQSFLGMRVPKLSRRLRMAVTLNIMVALVTLCGLILSSQGQFTSVAAIAEVGMDAGGFPIKQVPAVAIMFETRRGIQTSNIWERWFREAFDWIYTQGLEDPQTTPMDKSNILRAFVNYSPSFKSEAVREFMPPTLKHALIPAPTDCVWDNLTPCNYRLFLEAYTQMPTAEYFILVSENSMPLKTFGEIFQALKQDRRIRTSLYDLNYTKNLPKSTTWRAEPRETVELRLWDPYWTNNTWASHSSGRGVCSPDECMVWQPLAGQFGKDAGSKFYYAPCADSLSCFMVDCWWDLTMCQDTGKVGPGVPFRWIEIKEDFLMAQLRDPNRWMIRKVSDGTLVGDKKVRLDDYVANILHPNYKDLRVPPHPAANETLPRLPGGSLYDYRRLYKEAKLYGLRDNLI